MKRISYILTAIFTLAACTDIRNSDPYQEGLNVLTVSAVYPQGHEDAAHEGVPVNVEDMNTASRYTLNTDATGTAVFKVPDGMYRVNMSDRQESDIYNGSADKFVVNGGSAELKLKLSHSRSGSIVIKEIYCGGCLKLPQEGTYQADQYFILHNNDFNVQYLDGLCFGTLSPYNSNGANPWLTKDPATGESTLVDFLPVIQAIWQFPGDGDDFPLQPGEDAVVCARGAIDHTIQYPLSVNLNREGFFVCYNNTYFPNTMFHPAPGDKISTDRYLDVVIKTGKANAYTLSNSSPTLVLFKAEGMTIQEFVGVTDNMTPVPGSLSDYVVKVPFEWVIDAVEVFDARSANNTKRLVPSLDAGYVLQTDTYLGRSLMRKTDEAMTASAGYEVLTDTNNSLNDFYETSQQSLHE